MPLLSQLVQFLDQRWMPALAHFLWQGMLVAIVAAAVRSFLTSAVARYRVLLAALLLMAAAPLCTLMLTTPQTIASAEEAASPAIARRSKPAATSTTEAATPAPSAPVGTPTAGDPSAVRQPGVPVHRPAAEAPVTIAAENDARQARLPVSWLPVVYCAIVALLLVRLTFGILGGKRLCQQAAPVADDRLVTLVKNSARQLGIRLAPVLAQCEQVTVPTVVGLLRTTILLPAACLSELSLKELETILLHELAHIRRHDFAVNILQRLVEAFLFFHPAVWRVSRSLATEREHCCDDLVVSGGANRELYARSLLHVAELSRRAQPAPAAAIGLHATADPSSLRIRVARLLGDATGHRRLRAHRAWPWALCAALLLVLVPLMKTGTTGQTPAADSGQEQSGQPKWGEENNGLRMRALAVITSTDEQKPAIATAEQAVDFATPADVTLVIELKNVGPNAINLQGVRYSDSVTPPWPGKSVSREFAPHLFGFRVLDSEGQPVLAAQSEMRATDIMLTLSSGSAETLQPGESVAMLVQPLQWDISLARVMEPGIHHIEVYYQGTPEDVQEQIRKRWPDKPLGSVWTGKVAAPAAGFNILARASRVKPQLVWGEPKDGLRVAAEYRLADTRSEVLNEYRDRVFPTESKIAVNFHVQNVGDKERKFESAIWRQDDQVFLVDTDGKDSPLNKTWYSGWPRTSEWTLAPKQIAIIPAIPLGLTEKQQRDAFEHPVGAVITGPPGKIQVRHQLNDLGVSTGATSLTVRPRKPTDNPATFTTKIRFRTPDGSFAQSGYAQASVRKSLFDGDFDKGVVEVAGCTSGDELRVYVRTPGFEETRFYDVEATADGFVDLELTPADPVRFRLVDRAGKPVAGAAIRYFNRSKKAASVGPYPTQQLSGPIYTTSAADGTVVLDTVQRFDPADTKLGNNIYWFYIEPKKLAPLFVGPVEAGDDLGDVTVGPLLEVRGEVRGTAEELKNFAAEWDQPAEMLRGDGVNSWHFAISKRLKTKREGDKLTFHLTGLRPGKLRIISNFNPRPHSVGHVYSRRKVGPDDVVLEVDLQKSRSDVMVKNDKEER